MAGDRRTSRCGWIWRSRVVPVRSSGTTTSSQRLRSSPHYAGSLPPPSINSRLSTIPCWSLLHSLRNRSLIVTMRAAVEECDDLSSEGSLMLLSPPHDLPTATLPVETTATLPPMEDVAPPVVVARRVTPANRALRYLEAGTLGASEPHHVPSRPSVPDLCIASLHLLSVTDPLPLDRLSRHSVATVRSWPSTDHRHLLAVANRDIRVARQNLAELQLYIEDHTVHVANCAGADDDEVPLMSAETFPRLEGGIRAALEEVDRR